MDIKALSKLAPKFNLSDFRKKETIITIVLLAIIVFTAFWFRSFPARFGELQAIDPFYLYRMSEHVMENNWQLPALDMMRHHPFGADPITYDPPVLYYLPVLLFVMFGGLGMSYFNFALLFPAMMGALAVFFAYFLGKEVKDRKTGLFTAFFMGVLPAFITRTSAGFFEKEGAAAPFIVLSIYFFIKAFKTGSWKYGILSGIFLVVIAQAWGGYQYFFLLIGGFAMFLALIDQHHKKLLNTYIPIYVVIMLAAFILPYKATNIVSSVYMFITFVAVILIIRSLVERYKLVKKDMIPFVALICLVLGGVIFLFSTMFFEVSYNLLINAINVVSIEKSLAGTTVAEQMPGDWNAIYSSTGAFNVGAVFPWLTSLIPYLSIYVFMFIGIAVMGYVFVRQFFIKRDWILIFVIFWTVSSIVSVFGMIRLLFLLGPPIALTAAYAVSWLINSWHISMEKHIPWSKIKQIPEKYMKMIPIVAIAVTLIFVGLLVTINTASAYSYSNSVGPSFNNYWKEAMTFLADETPENSNILSWWDFGYWFQTRGQRPSVSDGGGAGPRYDIALWFMNDAKNWSDYTCDFQLNEKMSCEQWLKERYHVDYIVMDYTLPGKYGAITKIGTNGKNPVGILQFQQTKSYPQGNKTIHEFTYGPYSIWLPFVGDGLSGTPMFLISDNGQVVSTAYVNDVCTNYGMIRTGDKTPDMGGCVAITNFGVFYVPPEAKDNVFSNLMFMDGAGLPVNKVFDNGAVKIYEVLYGDETEDAAEGTSSIEDFMDLGAIPL